MESTEVMPMKKVGNMGTRDRGGGSRGHQEGSHPRGGVESTN